ncbi:MAG: acetylglutamate kinase [Candidatus Obscuribacterales bacterium]|nr:acetylglutamate kinase [Candidatus Obscuribacterales bacterium]
MKTVTALLNDGANLEKFDGQVTIVKFGGNAIGSEDAINSLIDDTIKLIEAGVKVVVVHGGGTKVNDALALIGKKTQKVDGLRVTDSETLDIAVSTFTLLNEALVQKFRDRGANAISFSSQSSCPLIAKKMEDKFADGAHVDMGWVGEITGVDTGSMESWLWAGGLPVISPLALDLNGHFYNVNADHAALAVASCLQAQSLVFMTDVSGVLKEITDPSSRIGVATPDEMNALIEDGTISGGMLVKIKSCLSGIKNGIERISILNGFESHSLLNGFVDPQLTGTVIAEKAA